MSVKIQRAASPRLYLLFVSTSLAVCILLLAFTLSLRAATRQFEHALIAERQAVLVEGIARDSDSVNGLTVSPHFAKPVYRTYAYFNAQINPQSVVFL